MFRGSGYFGARIFACGEIFKTAARGIDLRACARASGRAVTGDSSQASHFSQGGLNNFARPKGGRALRSAQERGGCAVSKKREFPIRVHPRKSAVPGF